MDICYTFIYIYLIAIPKLQISRIVIAITMYYLLHLCCCIYVLCWSLLSITMHHSSLSEATSFSFDQRHGNKENKENQMYRSQLMSRSKMHFNINLANIMLRGVLLLNWFAVYPFKVGNKKN